MSISFCEQQDGLTYIIQDLPEEHFDDAVMLLTNHFNTDEVLCVTSDLTKEPESVRSMAVYWFYFLAKKMSLACYAVRDGVKKLVGVNICYVACKEETNNIEILGESWKNIHAAIEYCTSLFNIFDYIGQDKILSGLGLVVDKKYRNARLGTKIIATRGLLARFHGITASFALYTSITSQKAAARCSFEPVLEVHVRDLVNFNINFPKDDPRSMKLMVRRYD